MSKSVSRLTNLLLSSNGSDIALLLLRIFVGIMMLTHGVAKIENFSALKANFPDPVGLGAGFSLLLITCAEVGCSLLVIVGLVTRLAVIPLIVGMCVAAFLTFPGFTMAASELALLYLSIYITLLIAGPGEYSLDELLRMTLRRKNSK